MTAPDWDAQLAAQHLAARDDVLAQVIERVGPCRLRCLPEDDPFRALLHAIVYQQLSGRAAQRIHERVLALFPQARPEPSALLALPDAALRGAGMSRGKIAAARDLAARVLDGSVPPAGVLRVRDDAAVMQTLTAVRGIGPWTAQMYLMFRLGRPDVLPASDLGLLRGFLRGWQLPQAPTAAELLAHGARWAPYRSAASWYLWALADDGGAPGWEAG